MSLTKFSTGVGHAFCDDCLALVSGALIRYFGQSDAPNPPAAIPVEMRYLGWRESLEQLTPSAEPEIANE